jgi:hypothetical protein
VVGDPHRASGALDQLRWVVERQTLDGHFNFTPIVRMWGPVIPGVVTLTPIDAAATPPMFEQQPIEAWAMANACARAFACTLDHRWAEALEGAAAWFLGDNDVGVAVFDPAAGGGFDGLESNGVNRNEGAASIMAFVGTMLDLHELTLELGATPN